MSNEKIQQLLAELQNEIQKTNVDAGTRESLQALDADINVLLNSTAPESNAVLEQAKLLEAKFAASHPTVERVIREVIDTLAKMGV